MGNTQQNRDYKPNPFLPVIGFVVLLVLGGIAYLLSLPAYNYVTSASLSLGPGFTLFPIDFPNNWPLYARQLVITLAIFGMFFVIFMIGWAAFVKPPAADPRDANIQALRAKKEKAKKKR